MKDMIINEQIRSAVVTLILPNGDKKGQFTKAAAIQLARNDGLDLIQVAPGNPPICKIADYGKMRYKASKTEKHSQGPKQKEAWFFIKTQQHDIDISMRKVTEWLKKGHKVRLVVELEGREKYTTTHRGMAKELVSKLIESTKEIAAAGKVSEDTKTCSVTLAPN